MRFLVFIIICTAIVQACLHNGYRRAGETWVEGRFRLQCVHGTGWERVEIIGCVTLRGRWMSIGSFYREGSKNYYCKKSGYDRYVLEASGY